ncbi:MAG TPA: hypothetical protein VK009_19795 [Chloroflexota bacterium]|nr:hypothetical protein [Chloroflexota bacterium]
MKYAGPSNFAVEVLDGTGSEIGLLANVIGSYSGSQFQQLPSAGQYVFQVQASAPWTITLQNFPAWPSGQTPNGPITGKGPAALALQLNGGLVTFAMTHDGKSNFAVTFNDASDNEMDLLANVIGPFNGSQAEGVPAPGVYLLNVEADGNWSISVQ